MDKVYRVTLIFLIILLILANVVFFAIGDKFLTYFNFNTNPESPQQIINQARIDSLDKGGSNLFDFSLTDKEKFKNLKYFEINLDDIILPGDLSPGEQIEIGDDGEIIIDNGETKFEVGNPNPFDPIF